MLSENHLYQTKRSDVSSEEMHQLLSKLKELVPGMPRHQEISKLEIMQKVIDYISDLENVLQKSDDIP